MTQAGKEKLNEDISQNETTDSGSSENAIAANSESDLEKSETGATAESEITQEAEIDLEQKLKEEEKKYLYLYSEFENFKRRAVKERSETIKFGWEPIARELLEVLDNMDLALGHANPSTDKALVDGLNMIIKQFRDTLEKRGVVPIRSSRTPFDPNLHEAIGKEHSDEEPEGHVLKEHLKGYTLHGRLLRPARVVISGGQKIEEEKSSK
jgi:molecular chaperone GrpE